MWFNKPNPELPTEPENPESEWTPASTILSGWGKLNRIIIPTFFVVLGIAMLIFFTRSRVPILQLVGVGIVIIIQGIRHLLSVLTTKNVWTNGTMLRIGDASGHFRERALADVARIERSIITSNLKVQFKDGTSVSFMPTFGNSEWRGRFYMHRLDPELSPFTIRQRINNADLAQSALTARVQHKYLMKHLDSFFTDQGFVRHQDCYIRTYRSNVCIISFRFSEASELRLVVDLGIFSRTIWNFTSDNSPLQTPSLQECQWKEQLSALRSTGGPLDWKLGSESLLSKNITQIQQAFITVAFPFFTSHASDAGLKQLWVENTIPGTTEVYRLLYLVILSTGNERDVYVRQLRFAAKQMKADSHVRRLMRNLHIDV